MKRQKGKSQKQETGSKEHIDCRLIFTNVLQTFTLFVTFLLIIKLNGNI